LLKGKKEKGKQKAEEIEESEVEDRQENEEVENAVEEKNTFEMAEEKISELEGQVKELEDKYLRKVAEFENYKRRVENDQFNLITYGAESFIVKLLPVIDDFERSFQHINSTENSEAIKEGVKLVYEKLTKLLDEQGVKKMESVGKPFNVDFHDALMQRKDESVEPHTVLEEIESGYIYRDKVIRHAKVIVSEDISEDSVKNDEFNSDDADNNQEN
jgi:molecular chaperone GrpE